jgi:putative RNA 2'-phosphotransferase
MSKTDGGSQLNRVADLLSLSRAVSHALRREPWLYELELDEGEWASVESVLAAFTKERPEWADLCEADLVRMIEDSSKRRHEVKEGRIRALYGHSIPGKVKRTPVTPPDVLYHGTAPDVIELIRSLGLLPMGRQYVHLSVDEATALEVGRRKTRKPTIVRVLAAHAHVNGIGFYEGNEKVSLAGGLCPGSIHRGRVVTRRSDSAAIAGLFHFGSIGEFVAESERQPGLFSGFA